MKRCLYLITAMVAVWAAYDLFVFISLTKSKAAVFNLGIDTPTYLAMAKLVASEGLSAVPLSQPPGHLTFLAFMQSFADPVAATKLANFGLWMLVVLLTFLTGRKLFGAPAGTIAALLVSYSPGLRAYAATIQYEMLASTLFCAALFLCVRRYYLLSAFAIGIAALVREPLALFFPFLAFLAFKQGGARQCVFAAIAFLLPVGAWIGFQAFDKGAIVPISRKSEINVQVGNNPKANGTYNVVRDGMAEPAGILFVREHPGTALHLALRKAAYQWSVLRDGWNVPRYGTLMFWRASLGLLSYRMCMWLAGVALLVPMLLGVLVAEKSQARSFSRMLFGLLLCSTLFYCCFIGSYRFLVPLLPAVYLLCGVAIGHGIPLLSKYYRVVLPVAVIWTAASILIRPSWEITLGPKDLDGMRVQEIVSPSPALYAPGEPEPRLIALFAAEYFPAGEFTVEIQYRSEAPAPERLAKGLLRRPDGKELCAADLTAGAKRSDLSCTLRAAAPIGIEVHSRSKEPVWIHSIRLASAS